MVKIRSEPENAAGKAKFPKVFFREGQSAELEESEDSKPADDGEDLLFSGQVRFLPSSFELNAALMLGITQSPR